MALNVRLLRRVQRWVLEEPERLNMSDWITKRSGPPCGTVGCIAGWTVVLSEKGYRKKILGGGEGQVRNLQALVDAERFIDQRAADLLGLYHAQASLMFHVSQWPERFRDRYQNARTARQRAKVTAERIEHFIEEGV